MFPEQAEGLLITEKVRAAGANVLNIDGEQFVYEREPRDVEASAFIRECTVRGKGIPTSTGKFGVWLDSPMIDIVKGEGTVRNDVSVDSREGEFTDFSVILPKVLPHQNEAGEQI